MPSSFQSGATAVFMAATSRNSLPSALMLVMPQLGNSSRSSFLIPNALRMNMGGIMEPKRSMICFMVKQPMNSRSKHFQVPVMRLKTIRLPSGLHLGERINSPPP